MKPLVYPFLFFALTLGGCKSLKPSIVSDDSKIIVLNIKDYSRAEIAEYLTDLSKTSLKVLGMDVWFVDRKDSLSDLQLKKSLARFENIVLACALNDLDESLHFTSLRKTNSYLVSKNPVVAFSNTFRDENDVPISFPITAIKRIERAETDTMHLFHFSLRVSLLYDENKIPSYIDYLDQSDHPLMDNIVYSKTMDQYPTYDLAKVKKLNPEIFRDKIVLVGYAGPLDEDKSVTPLRYRMRITEGSDTYGVYILANIIDQILVERKDLSPLGK